MRAPLSLAAGLLCLSGAAQALTIEARVRAPLGELLRARIEDSARLACQLMTGCEKAVYRPDDSSGMTGKAVFKGQGYRPELGEAQRKELLARLDALWGEPVSVLEDAGLAQAPQALGPRRPQPSDKLSQALPSLLPAALANGASAGAFYDQAGRHDGEVPTFAAWAAQNKAAQNPLAPLFTPKTPAPAQTPAVERAMRRATPYAKEIAAAAKREGIAPEVLTAVVGAKSGFRPGVSGGLTGLASTTFAKLGPMEGDIHDPQANLYVGAHVLAGLLKQFDGDVHRALAAYQVGPRAVLVSGGIPNDRAVHEFLAAYEREYRRGPVKPEVVRPEPPPLLRRLKDREQLALAPSRAPDTSSVDPTQKGAAYWRPLIRRMAARHAGVDPALMEAMVMPESGGDPSAVSPKGARGLGQLMPETAAELGVKNPHDPAQNLRGMSDHLNYLLGKYDDPVLAVAAYNAGEARVNKAGFKIPRIGETVSYVRTVFENYFHLTGKKVDVDPYIAPKPERKPKKPRRIASSQ